MVDTPNVRGDFPLITKTLAEKLVSQATRKALLRFDGSEDDLGTTIGAGKGVVNSAINQRNLLSLHTAFNLLKVDPYALEGLLNHCGRRSVPITAKCDTDVLVPVANAVSKIASGRVNGKLTDHECLEIEPDLEAAVDALLTLKDRCVAIRKSRAA